MNLKKQKQQALLLLYSNSSSQFWVFFSWKKSIELQSGYSLSVCRLVRPDSASHFTPLPIQGFSKLVMVVATVCKSSTCLLYFILTNDLKNPSTLDPALFNIVNLSPPALSLSYLKIALVNLLLWSNVSLQSLRDYRLIFRLLKNVLETSQPSTRVSGPLHMKQWIISLKPIYV